MRTRNAIFEWFLDHCDGPMNCDLFAWMWEVTQGFPGPVVWLWRKKPCPDA